EPADYSISQCRLEIIRHGRARRSKKGRRISRPLLARPVRKLAAMRRDGLRAAASAPYIDAYEQEQPHHVDEVPVPGKELEPEMLGRDEMARIGASEADKQEASSDDNVEAVETRRHEEGGAIDIARETEGGMAVLVSLHTSESQPESDGQH